MWKITRFYDPCFSIYFEIKLPIPNCGTNKTKVLVKLWWESAFLKVKIINLHILITSFQRLCQCVFVSVYVYNYTYIHNFPALFRGITFYQIKIFCSFWYGRKHLKYYTAIPIHLLNNYTFFLNTHGSSKTGLNLLRGAEFESELNFGFTS